MGYLRKRLRTRHALLLCAAFAALLVLGVSAAAGAQFHGIAFVKGCSDPTNIGDPNVCAYQILNVIDTGHDTLVVTGLSDQVHAASGDVNSGNILGALQLTVSGGATCLGGSGTGTAGDPYIGATSCTLPFGSTVESNFHSFYTVQPADYGLPNHTLTDSATLTWHNTCTAVGIENCTTDNQPASAGSSTFVNQLHSSTASLVHDSFHNVVTDVPAGTSVHDLVIVTGQPGQPIPTGNVNIDWFSGSCSGAPLANSGSTGPLAADGQFDAAGFSFTPTAGIWFFRAHYEGDATYAPSDGPCEQLTATGDTTPPVTAITLTPGAPNGNNGWYTSPVTVGVSATDDTALATTSCELDPLLAPVTFDDIAAGCAFGGAGASVSEDGAHAIYAASEDGAGNKETPVSASFEIDQTAPTVTCPVPAPTFAVGSTGNQLTASVGDSGSGPLSTSVSAAAPATTAGVQSVSLTGEDMAGNQKTVSCSYVVGYRFVGFFSPLPGSGWNRGQTIPVKFALSDADGVRISDATAASLLSPTCKVKFSAGGAATQNPICVRYDAAMNQFVFNWKVPKGSSTGIATLRVDITIGTATDSHSVNIRIVK